MEEASSCFFLVKVIVFLVKVTAAGLLSRS